MILSKVTMSGIFVIVELYIERKKWVNLSFWSFRQCNYFKIRQIRYFVFKYDFNITCKSDTFRFQTYDFDIYVSFQYYCLRKDDFVKNVSFRYILYPE